MFLSEAGKNITPDKLHVAERSALNRICDASFCEIVKLLGSSVIVGVGKYACGRARSALQEHGVGYVHVMDIMHPSPANPQANKAWREIVLKQLSDLGLMMYLQPSHPGAWVTDLEASALVPFEVAVLLETAFWCEFFRIRLYKILKALGKNLISSIDYIMQIRRTKIIIISRVENRTLNLMCQGVRKISVDFQIKLQID